MTIFKIKNKEALKEEVEPVIELWLDKNDTSSINIVANNGSRNVIIGQISKDGLRLAAWAQMPGLATDDDGRIKLI